MGFTNTHSWTYIEKAYYPIAPSSTRQLGTYYNNSGSSKKIKSVTFYCATGSGTKGSDDKWGSAVSGNGKSITMKLVINGVESNEVTISNTSSVYSTTTTINGVTYNVKSFTESSCTAKTFNFSDGPVISNGSTVSITATLSGSGTVLVVRPERSSGSYISGTVVDPYTAPSYSYDSISPTYGIWNSTSFKPKYTISGGTGSIDWTIVKIFNSSDTYLGQIDLGNKSKGTITSSFKLGSGYSDGTQYKTSIRFSDCTQELETSKKTIYTYRTPKISSVSLSPTSFSGTGNSTLKWSTNGRRWGTSYESNFTTTYKFNTNGTVLNAGTNNPNTEDSTNTMSAQSMTLSKSIIDSSFTAAQRSQEKITTTVTMIRTNPTSGVTASSSSGNITIQFWPKYEISSLSYTNPSNNNTISAGTTQYIDALPKVRVNWAYSNSADRGIIDGFIIRIYRSDKSTLVGNAYYMGASDTYKDFDLKTQLKRGELNYIKITPYYNLPSGGVKEGPATIQTFIKPLGRIRKPEITYPINNTTWHNKNFRILLRCPIDDDFDQYGLTEANYRYKDIQLYIEGPNFSATYSYSANPTIFSTATMSYQKYIAINPSIITSFPLLTYYKMKIRFQKNYYENIWSEWSDIIQLNESTISELNINKETKILQSQYKTVRDYSVRLWNVYHKSTEQLDSNNVARSVGDIIQAKNYTGIYNTILAIYNRVNGWCDYDTNRSNVKFTQTITNLSNTLVPVRGELITASKVSNEPSGRNYKNILIECMNKLN